MLKKTFSGIAQHAAAQFAHRAAAPTEQGMRVVTPDQ
jgi:hypothetical protein